MRIRLLYDLDLDDHSIKNIRRFLPGSKDNNEKYICRGLIIFRNERGYRGFQQPGKLG